MQLVVWTNFFELVGFVVYESAGLNSEVETRTPQLQANFEDHCFWLGCVFSCKVTEQQFQVRVPKLRIKN